MNMWIVAFDTCLATLLTSILVLFKILSWEFIIFIPSVISIIYIAEHLAKKKRKEKNNTENEHNKRCP